MIPALVLAAGASRRMGAQKLLLPYAGTTVAAHIVRRLRAGGAAPIVAVANAAFPEVVAALEAEGAVVVLNPAPDAGGMLGSIRIGLEALPGGVGGVLIALGDMPGIQSELAAALAAAFQETPDRIVVPECNGRTGHPVVVPAAHFHAIQTQFDGEGLRGLMQARPESVRRLPVDAALWADDIDEPADYRRALRALGEMPVSKIPDGGHHRSS